MNIAPDVRKSRHSTETRFETRRQYIIRKYGCIDCTIIVRDDGQTFISTSVVTLHITRGEAVYALWTAKQTDGTTIERVTYRGYFEVIGRHTFE